MGYKEDFLKDIDASLPEGVLGLLEVAIPEAPSVTISDVDSAIIAQGILAKYLLDLFDTFRGLTPIELLLRIGQKNATLQSALLAGIEYNPKKSFEFSILSPQKEGFYFPEQEIQFSAEIMSQKGFEACTGIVVSISEVNQTFTLEKIEDLLGFRKNMVVALPEVVSLPMSLTARFMASFEGAENYTKSVEFQISPPV